MPALLALAASGFTSNALYVKNGLEKIVVVSTFANDDVLRGPFKYKSNMDDSRQATGVVGTTGSE